MKINMIQWGGGLICTFNLGDSINWNEYFFIAKDSKKLQYAISYTHGKPFKNESILEFLIQLNTV